MRASPATSLLGAGLAAAVNAGMSRAGYRAETISVVAKPLGYATTLALDAGARGLAGLPRAVALRYCALAALDSSVTALLSARVSAALDATGLLGGRWLRETATVILLSVATYVAFVHRLRDGWAYGPAGWRQDAAVAAVLGLVVAAACAPRPPPAPAKAA